MLFSLLKHYLDTDTALKVFQSVYCFTTSISHGVENYFPRLWGTGFPDAVFQSDIKTMTMFILFYLWVNVFCCLSQDGGNCKLYSINNMYIWGHIGILGHNAL